MKQTLNLFFLLLTISSEVFGQYDVTPVTGVSDTRPELYGLKNARVIVDYQTTIENADILISKGRIEAVGQNLSFPKGTIVYDLTGKTVYPSFIDIYGPDYGIKAASSTGPPSGSSAAVPAAPAERVADYWNDGINASFDVTEEFISDPSQASEYRQAGFGAVVAFKADGIARGTSALVSTADGKANNLILKNRASANYSLSKGRSYDANPVSQFGYFSLLRQLNYDVEWYKKIPAGYFHDDGLEAYSKNSSLPQIFEVSDKLEMLRVDNTGSEFGIKYIIKGTGDEYQTLSEIKNAGIPLIIPVNFPDPPNVKDPYDAISVSYSALKHYELAPSNLAMVSGEGLTFAITSDDLKKRTDFLANLKKAVKKGLPEKEALKALTYTPASMVGAADIVGALKNNMVANILVTSGNIFSDECIIFENWVQGIPYRFFDLRYNDARGTYALRVDTADYNLFISGKIEKPDVKITIDSVTIKGASFAREKDLVAISFERSGMKFRLTGYFSGKDMTGKGQSDDGKWFGWKALYKSSPVDVKKDIHKKEPDTKTGRIIHPFIAFGWADPPVRGDVLFKNATVWTNEKEGKILNADVLVKNGKIASVGTNLRSEGARIIDASGMHLTPGLIDEHSHIGIKGGVNESSQAVSSEVRVSDIINPEDPSIYRQLAGGVTTSHILHGSANPVGGQSAIIKNRWGLPAKDLIVENQVGFLKHALGENVKHQVNRYPKSRMGTEQIIRDAYQRAVDYNNKWKKWNALKPAERAGKVPPRRDLEMDALVDVLEKRSFIACHTYVQSEGAMIMNLAKDFGIKVNTLIHFNEGYKIADQIKEHGTAASVFSDWWDYKYEVYEGITYNAALLHSQGVLTCLHSDDAEMGRRLNQEAGKIIKYGGIPETEALKLITLNPAKILHLDDRIGSIKAGKDADLVLWTDNPLSVYARVLKTMIDGTFYFDEKKDAEMKMQIDNERNRIIANILRESQQSGITTSNTAKR
jgi:imidazolonepropionase-like amidohydrolase